MEGFTRSKAIRDPHGYWGRTVPGTGNRECIGSEIETSSGERKAGRTGCLERVNRWESRK